MQLKGKILCGAVAAVLFNAPAFAASAWTNTTADPNTGDVDQTVATLTWKAKVPTVLSGKWITFTGEGSGLVKDGTISLKGNGDYASNPVKLELHWYDSDQGIVGPLFHIGDDINGSAPTGGGVVSKTLKYQVTPAQFSSSFGADLSTMKGILETRIGGGSSPLMIADPAAPIDASAMTDPAITEWSIRNAPGEGFKSITAGDELKITTTVTAIVDFA
ncbi:hypothetical protein [Vibrio parahaemolyticus]|uniref:hypothetical protein n=1 Tax=Vibrio parahaemolyticus TaxID=670 RepID=UPI00112102D1|nr:hypothetical protein [Vibrio parahaemolyticus]TOG87540.1 hypothetical protein CGI92_23770 [Vibrio parahaemolyticus]